MATLTGGRTGRSTLPPCDTPGDFHPAPDALSRAAAEAAWRSVTPPIAATPHVRVSRDGGRTFPARHARPLPDDPPGQPATVAVYDPGSATGRMLALDLDPSRIRNPAGVDDRAVQDGHEHRAGPAAEVAAQAASIAGLVARCGGQVLADVSPSGGRHVFVLFAAALPWRELRDLARAIALRFPAVDPAPMSSMGAQISPPGSRHKSGGWRLLSTPLSEARAAVEHPNGPGVWSALLTEFAAELQVSAARSAAAPNQASAACLNAELDDTGAPWIPRLGGRAPLGAGLDQAARTGRWDRSRYPDRSAARMAVLAAAAARGWQLADIHASNTPEPLHPYHYGFQQVEYRPANVKQACHSGSSRPQRPVPWRRFPMSPVRYATFGSGGSGGSWVRTNMGPGKGSLRPRCVRAWRPDGRENCRHAHSCSCCPGASSRSQARPGAKASIRIWAAVCTPAVCQRTLPSARGGRSPSQRGPRCPAIAGATDPGRDASWAGSGGGAVGVAAPVLATCAVA